MLYQLLGQGHPYVFEDAEKYLPAYRAHRAAYPKLTGAPRGPASPAVIEEALHRCLHPDPARRPSASDLHKALTGDPSGVVPTDDARRKHEEAEAREREVERIAEELRQREEEGKRKKEEAARLPTRIVLIGPDGAELSVGARLVLGRVVLAKFGPGARYAADHQFVLDRVDDAWFAEACVGTPNDTLLNGALLDGRAKLSVGDTIAVGKAASKRTVLELTIRGA